MALSKCTVCVPGFPDRIPDLPLDDKPSTEHQSEVSWAH